jgi:uncharacterized protein (TIGR00251 family)
VVDIQERKNALSFSVQVLPRSHKCALVGIQEGSLRLKLTAPPVDGRANEECLEFLAEQLGLKKGQLDIIHGHKSRKKVVQIEGLTREQLEARLSLLMKAEFPNEQTAPEVARISKRR